MRITFPSHNLLWFLQARHEICQTARVWIGISVSYQSSQDSLRVLAYNTTLATSMSEMSSRHCQPSQRSCQVGECYAVAPLHTSVQNAAETIPHTEHHAACCCANIALLETNDLRQLNEASWSEEKASSSSTEPRDGPRQGSSAGPDRTQATQQEAAGFYS